MQRLFDSRIARYLSHGMGFLAEARVPGVVLKPAIEAYSLGMGVDREGVVEPPGGFRSFGDFFARRLEDRMRPMPDEVNAMVSPCDGKLVGFGFVEKGSAPAFTIKGNKYELHQLLGSAEQVEPYEDGGGYAVIYLHPRDYHRVHTPVSGAMGMVRHIPGTRYPVAPWSEKRIDGIYGKNERVVFEVKTPGGGFISVVMVAAYGVSHIASEYCPEPDPDHSRTRDFSSPIELTAGDDLGAFRIGSTVVLLWSAGAVGLIDDLSPGRVVLGQRIGTVTQ